MAWGGRRFMASLRRNRRYVVVVLALSVVAVVALLLASVDRESFGGDLMMNLGFTLGGVVLTALVLQPVIESSQVPEVVVHGLFPHAAFHTGICRARHVVRMMGAWPYGMDLPWRQTFLDSLRECLTNAVHVQLLVLDPTSNAARQRTADMGVRDGADPDLGATAWISDALLELRRFADALGPDARSFLHVRIFSSLPPARLYRCDDRVFCSFFSDADNQDGSNVRHYETRLTGGLGYYVNDAFERLWSSHDVISLSQYWHLRVTVEWPEDRAPLDATHEVAYVTVDGELFLLSQPLFHDVGRDAFPVTLDTPGLELDTGDGHGHGLQVSAFDRTRDARADDVVRAANVKYGDEGQVFRSFLAVGAVSSTRTPRG